MRLGSRTGWCVETPYSSRPGGCTASRRHRAAVTGSFECERESESKGEGKGEAMRRVVAIDVDLHNTVLVGHDRYFLFQSDSRLWLVRDRCPHRGGPLSLGQPTPDGKRLICPWHGTKVSTAALRRTSVPAVRSGQRIVAVLPYGTDARDGLSAAGGVPVTVVRRCILANRRDLT
jgi:Rieske 2Fe-2S protein